MATAAVQCYFLGPTADAPNSRLPVLHYRNVLPLPLSEESVTEFLTQHAWEKRVSKQKLHVVVSVHATDIELSLLEGLLGAHPYPPLPPKQS
jgi:hypothetical protein